MSFLVCGGAVLTCPFGAVPASFSSLPVPGVLAMGRPAGAAADMIPMVNIPSFGTCSSLRNPTVAGATAAAMGVLTPMPCVPVPTGSWQNPSGKVFIGGRPALTSSSRLSCAWGGEIHVQFAGQTGVRL